MQRRWIAAVVGAAFLAVGCGDDAPGPAFVPARPATIAELTGPWRATPLLLDPVMWARVEQTCRRDIEMPPGGAVAVIDARGAGVATVRMTGDHAGSCDSLQITADGRVAGAGSGWRADGPERFAVLGAAALAGLETGSIGGGTLDVTGWSVYGRAGPAITTVIVEPANHPAVAATLMNGWFSAWWPRLPGQPAPDPGGGAQAQPPFVVQGFDADGTPVAVLRP
jgi:hypothetical protein